MATGHRRYVDALAGSHEHLEKVVSAVGQTHVSDPSYCSDWSVAQVLSHLGSGAEIGMLNLGAALAGGAAPAREQYEAIWDVWNAKSPGAQAEDALASDARSTETLTNLDDAALDGLRVEMRGRELDASGFVAMRLWEHALHAWDIEVMDAPHAPVQSGAVDVLIERVAERADRAARGERPAATPVQLVVTASEPARSFVFSITPDAVEVVEGSEGDANLSIPAEALLRLLAGRLDEAHTPPSVSVSGAVTLDELRTLFPGN